MKINPGNARGLLVPQGDRPFSFVVYSSEIRDFGSQGKNRIIAIVKQTRRQVGLDGLATIIHDVREEKKCVVLARDPLQLDPYQITPMVKSLPKIVGRDLNANDLVLLDRILNALNEFVLTRFHVVENKMRPDVTADFGHEFRRHGRRTQRLLTWPIKAPVFNGFQGVLCFHERSLFAVNDRQKRG